MVFGTKDLCVRIAPWSRFSFYNILPPCPYFFFVLDYHVSSSLCYAEYFFWGFIPMAAKRSDRRSAAGQLPTMAQCNSATTYFVHTRNKKSLLYLFWKRIGFRISLRVLVSLHQASGWFIHHFASLKMFYHGGKWSPALLLRAGCTWLGVYLAGAR